MTTLMVRFIPDPSCGSCRGTGDRTDRNGVARNGCHCVRGVPLPIRDEVGYEEVRASIEHALANSGYFNSGNEVIAALEAVAQAAAAFGFDASAFRECARLAWEIES